MGDTGAHRPQDHRRHLRRLVPARRRRLLRQGSDEGRPLGALHGAPHGQEHRGGRAGRRARRCRWPTPSASPSRSRSWSRPTAPARSRARSSRSSCAGSSTSGRAAIIDYLDLRRPIYRKTAAFGHFGRLRARLHVGADRSREGSPERRRRVARPCRAARAHRDDDDRSRSSSWSLAVVVLGVLAQVVPFYTDWLWFGEVGYTHGLPGTRCRCAAALFTARGRRRPDLPVGQPDLRRPHGARPTSCGSWRISSGCPGRVVIEPLIRRFLPVVLAGHRDRSGLRASAHWETVLGYLNAAAVRHRGPASSATTSASSSSSCRCGGSCTAGRSRWSPAPIVLTLVALRAAAQPRADHARPAAGRRRPHAPAAARRAAARPSRRVGFWLDRYEIVFSPRGVVFGASYTDVYATPAGARRAGRAGRRWPPSPAWRRWRGRACGCVAGGPGRCWPGVGGRPRHLSGAAAALPGDAQRAGRRAARSSSTTSG